MKKIVISFLAIGMLASCGNNSTETTSAPNDSADKQLQEPTTTQAPDPDIEKGLELIASNDCLTCHKVDEQLVGPAYKSVADKYKGNGADIIDTLAQRVIKGSMGHWGQIPMSPHPNLDETSAKAMVKYVLSLK